jgi:hypothetical protein
MVLVPLPPLPNYFPKSFIADSISFHFSMKAFHYFTSLLFKLSTMDDTTGSGIG